ncbi:hypothetical protein WKK05_26895 [Nostoc sp. UHCC 0302]|uniref:hypothetical protein n=1 Tax=Nostoc sp. UHCC 0302 TaxID=3134896 RepID=UPI00311CA68A
MTQVATGCAEHGNVKTEAATGCAEHGNVKAEAATGCAKHGNVKAEAATAKAEVATVAVLSRNSFLTRLPDKKYLTVHSHQSATSSGCFYFLELPKFKLTMKYHSY